MDRPKKTLKLRSTMLIQKTGQFSKGGVDAAVQKQIALARAKAVSEAQKADPTLKTYEYMKSLSPEERKGTFDKMRRSSIAGAESGIETGLVKSIVGMDTMSNSANAAGETLLFTAEQFQQTQKDINDAKIALGEFSFDDFLDGIRASMTYTQANQQQDIDRLGSGMSKKLKTGFRDVFSDALDGTKKLKDGFHDLFKAVGDMIQEKLIEMAVNKGFDYMFGVPRAAAAANNGGPIGFSGGGKVRGGSGSRDDVPAMLSRGEYVIRKSSVDKYGEGLLQGMNNGGVAGYRVGGMAGSRDPQAGLNSLLYSFGSGTTSGGASVNLRNAFVYGDNEYPTMKGSGYEIDKRLSRQALTDDENKRNTIRDKKFSGLHDYLKQRRDQEEAYQKALKRYDENKKKAWRKALVSAGIGMAFSYYSSDAERGLDINPKTGEETRKPMFASWGKSYNRGKTTAGKAYSGLKSLPGKAWGAGKSVLGGIGDFFRRNNGGPIGFASGGQASGRDSVYAMLTGGEMVMNKESVDKHGAAFFDKLNRGTLSGFASGGYVGSTRADSSGADFSSSGTGEITNNISISVNLDQSGNSAESVSVDSRGGSSLSPDAQQEVATMIKDAVVTTIVQQTRQGGVLSSSNSRKI